MKFLFIADPIEKLKAKSDTSFALARAALRLGNEVQWTTDQEVVSSDNVVSVTSARVSACAPGEAPRLDKKKREPLDGFQAVFIRKDPPFDSHYLRLCWLLQMAEEKVYFMNLPSRLLRYHEKSIPMQAVAEGFLKEKDLIPTFIGNLPGAQAHVRERQVARVVTKPFLGFGGRDLELVDAKAFLDWSPGDRNFSDLVMQPFYDRVYEGDRRVFFLNGELLAHVVRLPAQGGFISNLAQGGTAVSRPLREEEKAPLERLGEFLKFAGIHLAGADVIGDRISECNVTSPTGLVSIAELESHDYAEEIIRFVEKNAFYGR